jgi:4a-hydroxytetrahydrobiopterin dehydratase
LDRVPKPGEGCKLPGMATELTKKRCVPCESGVPPLGPGEVALLLPELRGWQAADDHRKLQKRITRPDFKQAMAFVNRMADLAEAEGHHPDFAVHYNKVDITLWTHDVGGLSENDFILAAKIDEIDQLEDTAPG